MNRDDLKSAARAMLDRAYCPYSHFPVGAALECEDGTVYTGCNVENASYGATNCEERTAFFKAVSDGKRAFTAIAIVGGTDGVLRDYCPPCGVCRQVMAEFCSGEFQILLSDGEEIRTLTLDDLLPWRFTDAAL